RLIRSGALYGSSDVPRNTADFIAAEQAFLEQRLASSRLRDAVAFERDMQSADRALSRASRWIMSCHARSLRELARAMSEAHRLLRRPPRFETRSDRELIGLMLTDSVRDQNRQAADSQIASASSITSESIRS